MASRLLSSLLFVLLTILTTCNRASAEDTPRTVLSASGAFTTQLTPQRVRVAIPLYAHTLSSSDSLDLIRERKELAKQRVASLSCIADSIQFGGITVETSDADARLNSSSLRILGAMGNDLDMEDLPVLVTARVDMTADWSVPSGADEEAVLGIVERIVADLKQQDITGKEARPDFSPKVEEALKQLQTQARSYVSSMNRTNLDEIRYAFVASPEQDQQSVAMQGAFADAKEQIDAIALAMGVTVGSPSMVNSNSSLRNNTSTVTHSYNGRNRVDILQAKENEILSDLYTGLTLSARVQVQYSVEKQ